MHRIFDALQAVLVPPATPVNPGQVWLAYNDPQFLVARHELKGCGPVAQKLRKALNALAQEATK